MLRSTSRIADLLQQDPPQQARQQGERIAAVAQLRVLLRERAPRLDLARELGLQLRDVVLELRYPRARLGFEGARLAALRLEAGAQLHELVGRARELLAEERAVEVPREQVLQRGRRGIGR